MLLQIGRGICFFIALKEAEDNLQKNQKNADSCSKIIDFA